MNSEQVLTLLGFLTDTITALSAQIDSLTAQVQALQQRAVDDEQTLMPEGGE